jgi:hypothetical protein
MNELKNGITGGFLPQVNPYEMQISTLNNRICSLELEIEQLRDRLALRALADYVAQA